MTKELIEEARELVNARLAPMEQVARSWADASSTQEADKLSASAAHLREATLMIGRLADALAARQPTEDGEYIIRLIDTIKRTGSSVEIHGVKIMPCDEYGRTAAVPDAATEAKQPEGWSTEDRREAKCEAERRWSRPVEREADYQRQSGTINGFMLGAEWQKARETFISYKAIADEARAERDAALAAVERIRQAVSGHPECDRYEEGDVISCGWKSAYASVLAALEGAPEPEWEYQWGEPGESFEGFDSYATEELARAEMELDSEYPSHRVMRRRKAGPWLLVEGESK